MKNKIRRGYTSDTVLFYLSMERKLFGLVVWFSINISHLQGIEILCKYVMMLAEKQSLLDLSKACIIPSKSSSGLSYATGARSSHLMHHGGPKGNGGSLFVQARFNHAGLGELTLACFWPQGRCCLHLVLQDYSPL